MSAARTDIARTRAHGFAYAAGVHVAGTAIWCDAARARAVSFVSRADVALGRGRAERVIATERAVALRRALGPPGMQCADPLLPRYGRPFALGRARVELLPGGRSPGAAQLLVELGGWRGLYAGAVGLSPIAGVEPAQVRACDEIVLDPPAPGGVVDGVEALRSLAREHGAVQVDVDELAALGAVLAALEPGQLVLSPRWRRVARAWPGRAGDPRGAKSRAAVSIKVRAGARRPDESDVLALGLLPDAAALARHAGDSGARRAWVRVDGSEVGLAGARALLDALGALGLAAAPLGPPQQLPLFAPPRRAARH